MMNIEIGGKQARKINKEASQSDLDGKRKRDSKMGTR